MAESAGARKRVDLVEVLIGAVCAGGPRLARARSDFEEMDPSNKGIERLMRSVVDPELLAAVVGPRLVPVWVEPLRARFAWFRQTYPADWVDVEKVWRQQRARWRRPAAGAGSGSAAVATGSRVRSRGYPHRDPEPPRAGPVRAGRRSAPVLRGERPATQPPPAHRPVPASVAAVDDPDVEPVVAPPDPVASGEVAAELADEAARQVREGDEAPKAVAARKPAPPPDPGVARGPVPGGGVNGVPAAPPPAPRPAVAASSSRGAPSSEDARIVLSGGAGSLVDRFLRAMADSRAQVDSVRRVWIDADGLVGGWDLWALDMTVADRVRALQRGRER